MLATGPAIPTLSTSLTLAWAQNVDAGNIWIVWNSAVTKVWSFTKVDSVVGTRCYFAQPRARYRSARPASRVTARIRSRPLLGRWFAIGFARKLQAFFTAGTSVTVAATDIPSGRCAFAVCRMNSILGAGSYSNGASDGLDGLGYNSVNASGVCPRMASANHPAPTRKPHQERVPGQHGGRPTFCRLTSRVRIPSAAHHT